MQRSIIRAAHTTAQMAPPELTPVGFRDQLAYKAFKMAVESSWQTLRSWKLSQKRAMNAEETEKVKDMWMLEEKLDEVGARGGPQP